MKAHKLFVLGGHATFTVSNGKGEHFTYRVTEKETPEGKPIYFASVLAGPEFYAYVGVLNADRGVVYPTAKSKYRADSQNVQVLNWALGKLWKNEEFPAGYACDTDGRCGRCGRELTHPDGVNDEGFRLGFGPVCFAYLQKRNK